MKLKLLFLLYFSISGVISKPATQDKQKSKGRKPPVYVNEWEQSGEYEGDIILDRFGPRNMQKDQNQLWPNGIVPYTIKENDYDKSEEAEIQKTIKYLEDVIPSLGVTDGSCQIKFVPRTKEENFVHIEKDKGSKCASKIGMHGGEQILTLSKRCLTMKIMLHEFCHLLGLAHQQSAHNRDDYVKIMWGNIEPGKQRQFKKMDSTTFTDRKLGYDYKSIMHYSPYAFAKTKYNAATGNTDYVGPTIVPLDPKYTIERAPELTKTDKMKLKLLYCDKNKAG